MTIAEVREKYLEFFRKRGHKIIPNASLVPENDPTTLFTGSGMQPLVPYLLGQSHPQGKRLVNSQKCFRSEDIEEVGDNRHTTFFEMLGNWSFGDYWKKEQLGWLFEFLTEELRIRKERLWVTCFEGDEKWGLPRDDESAGLWEKLGIPKDRIHFYEARKNWWSRSGIPKKMPVGEPGGPDSEIFYEFAQIPHDQKFGEKCHPNCDCGRFMEIGNSVFMEFRKTESGFEKLPQRNVDFGGGLERITAAVNDEPDIFRLDVFRPIIDLLVQQSSSPHLKGGYELEKNRFFLRITADHLRAATFLILDGVTPSKEERGYMTRKLLRKLAYFSDYLEISNETVVSAVSKMVSIYKNDSFLFSDKVATVVKSEIDDFRFRVLPPARRALEKLEHIGQMERVVAGKELSTFNRVDAKKVFGISQSLGFQLDLIEWELAKRCLVIDKKEYAKEVEQHRKISRIGAERKFKGGLADTSEMSLKYHTATHLLHQALRDVMGNEVRQRGSNITPERLRFDFAFPRKMTDEEKKRVESLVNGKIRENLPVHKVTLPLEQAKKSGALHFFDEKYPDQVLVHYIGDSLQTAYSKEFCGGPHVGRTGVLGTFKIIKEEAVSAGVRRIKAQLM